MICPGIPRRSPPILLLLAALGLSGCQRDHATLLVSAAASLTEVMGQLEARYEAAHPGVDVRLNLASSGALARQIEAGADVDVFASASVDEVSRLKQSGRVEGGAVVFARNQLVLVSAAEAVRPGEPAALLEPSTGWRVAVGEPGSVPAGAYARGAMSALGLWAPLQEAGRLVFAGDVRHALALAARGEVELAAVYATDLRRSPDLKVVARFGPPAAPDIAYGAAVIRGTDEPQAAADFLALMTGPEGRAILSEAGFLVP